MRFRASDVAGATGGELTGPDATFDGVSFDTRSLRPGQLFVPLVAERDGHRFVPAALAAGAAGFLTSVPPDHLTSGWSAAERRAAEHTAAIVVPDTLRALMDLATARRAGFAGTVVGITGSVGKTSTKDLAWAAVGAGRRTVGNVKSFNNDFGLPTTLLNAPDDTEVLILEMGMRGRGEIARLCAIAAPTVGIVTRVAEAHSDLLGGVDGVAEAKSELVVALPPTATAILNADDPRVAAMARRAACRVVTYGTSPAADVRVGTIALDGELRPHITASTPWGTVQATVGLRGEHMAVNAGAALALAGVLGVDLHDAAAALAGVDGGPRRMSIVTAAGGGVILDDSYNANPTSMLAGLHALLRIPARRRVALLGVMAEIADAQALHRGIASFCAEHDIELVPSGTNLYGVEPAADPLERVGSVAAGEAVLVKGSLVAGMDRFVTALRGE